jgi:hypothetical protein
MSGQQEPVLLLDMFIQEPELHLEVSRLQELVLLLEGSTLQRPVLYLNCLHRRGQCYAWILDYTGACPLLDLSTLQKPVVQLDEST